MDRRTDKLAKRARRRSFRGADWGADLKTPTLSDKFRISAREYFLVSICSPSRTSGSNLAFELCLPEVRLPLLAWLTRTEHFLEAR